MVAIIIANEAQYYAQHPRRQAPSSLGSIELSFTHGASGQIGRINGVATAKLSLADCFALALAMAESALLITTDGELARITDVRVRHIKI
jgi:uncharacterized protein with PIN domain